MSDLPASVQIGPHRYRITEDQSDYHRAASEADHGVWARINHARGDITLDPNQTEMHKRASLLHEVIHGVWHLHDPEVSSAIEETLARSLATMLLDTLQRNPDLVAYLLEPEPDA